MRRSMERGGGERIPVGGRTQHGRSGGWARRRGWERGGDRSHKTSILTKESTSPLSSCIADPAVGEGGGGGVSQLLSVCLVLQRLEYMSSWRCFDDAAAGMVLGIMLLWLQPHNGADTLMSFGVYTPSYLAFLDLVVSRRLCYPICLLI